LSTSTQFFTKQEESIISLLLFDIVSTTFIPGKISPEKVSKLMSIAELRAFYGYFFYDIPNEYLVPPKEGWQLL